MDYPDHTRLFHLVGTSITIPISIEASEVTIPVSIAASDVTLNVYLGSMPFETTAQNLLTNPGFEDGDLTGWNPVGAGTVTVQAVELWKGSYAAKVEPDASDWQGLDNATRMPCYPGQRILVSAALKADANITASWLYGSFFSAEDEWVETVDGDDYGGDYDWDPKVATVIAPDGAAFVHVGAHFISGDPAGVGYADSFIAVRLVQPALDSSLNLNINIVAQDIAALDINLTASDITLNVNLAASDITLDVNIAASDITINVNLTASDITLNVNLQSQTANIDISFEDQSVAVFDAAKWFAHQAQQIFVLGTAYLASGVQDIVASRTVPANTTYFITVMGGGYNGAASAHVAVILSVGGTEVITVDGVNGQGLTFDTPIRATTGQVVRLYMVQWSDASATCRGSFGGYDEI